MSTSVQSIALSFVRRVVRHASVVVIAGSVLLTGCAGSVTNASQFSSATPQVRPDNIYVYTFASSPDQVKLDSGIAQRLKATLSGKPADAQQAENAQQASDKVADEIVARLQKMGLRAIRSDRPAPADQNVLMVQGNFDTIDQGSRRRRMLVGFGAGESQVGASVQVLYQPAGGSARVVQSFDATADSGHAPGVAATAGVGAAAGRVASTAALGTGMHGVSEAKHDTISADASRLADSIAKQVAQVGVTEGWMSASQVK